MTGIYRATRLFPFFFSILSLLFVYLFFSFRLLTSRVRRTRNERYRSFEVSIDTCRYTYTVVLPEHIFSGHALKIYIAMRKVGAFSEKGNRARKQRISILVSLLRYYRVSEFLFRRYRYIFAEPRAREGEEESARVFL